MNQARIAQLLTFLQENPNDPFLQYALALEYLKINEPEKAVDLFTTLIEKMPNYVGTYYHLGKLFETRHEPEKALSTYQKGMEIAHSLGDNHSFNELRGAYQMLHDELYMD